MTAAYRISHATALILKAIASGSHYGFDIMDRTGLPSGTVYPALRRLEGRGLLETRWESDQIARADGRPRRKLFRLTRAGQRAVEDAERRLEETARLMGGLRVASAEGEGA